MFVLLWNMDINSVNLKVWQHETNEAKDTRCLRSAEAAA